MWTLGEGACLGSWMTLLARKGTGISMSTRGAHKGSGWGGQPQVGTLPQFGTLPWDGTLPQVGTLPQFGTQPQFGMQPQDETQPWAGTLPLSAPVVEDAVTQLAGMTSPVPVTPALWEDGQC